MLSRKVILPVLTLSAATLLGVTACGGSSTSAPQSSGAQSNAAPAQPIAVVASTSAYGSVVQIIGGDKVSVDSLVSKVSQDPHSYEATAQDKLKVSKAKLVVVNGAGYDPFMDGMVAEAKLDRANVITAADASGLKDDAPASPAPSASPAEKADFNEHVWYSFPAMQKISAAIEQRLSALAPASAAEFKHNADAFRAKLGDYQASLEKLKKEPAVHAAITEPVPLYLLQAAGMDNVTPEEFSHAVEDGHDVPAAVMDETVKLFSGKKADLLAYNEQTSGPQTETVKKAASDAGLPVVGFTETLPEGKDYLGWMADNIAHVQQAVQKVRG